MTDEHTKAEAAAVWVAPEELRPWRDNPRHNDKAVAKVAESLKRFGFGAPIVARKADGEVIAGHTRLKAALKLGLPKVPVRFVDLDPAEAHLLAIADNKTSELADWDDELLGAVLADLRNQDIDLTSGTGLSEGEIAKLIDDTHGLDEADAEIEEPNTLWGIVIECESESQQVELLQSLQSQGLKVRALI